MSAYVNGTLAFLVGILVIFLVVSKLELSLFESSNKRSNGSGTLSSASSNSGSGSATSGKLFKGEKIRIYESSKILFSSPKDKIAKTYTQPSDELKCERWSVVTTIFEPSNAVKKQAHMAGWCLVVVGDLKGPSTCEQYD